MHVNHAGDFPSSAGKSAVGRGRGSARESARLHNQLLIAFKMSQRWNTCNLARTVSKLMGARRRRLLACSLGRAGWGGREFGTERWPLFGIFPFFFLSDEPPPQPPVSLPQSLLLHFPCLAMITSLSCLFVTTHLHRGSEIKNDGRFHFFCSPGASCYEADGCQGWGVGIGGWGSKVLKCPFFFLH